MLLSEVSDIIKLYTHLCTYPHLQALRFTYMDLTALLSPVYTHLHLHALTFTCMHLPSLACTYIHLYALTFTCMHLHSLVASGLKEVASRALMCFQFERPETRVFHIRDC